MIATTATALAVVCWTIALSAIATAVSMRRTGRPEAVANWALGFMLTDRRGRIDELPKL